MILVHGYAPVPPLPSPSPYCVKLETWLRMASFAYEVRPDGRSITLPRGRAASVTLDDGATVHDIDRAIKILSQRSSVTLDRWLEPSHKATTTLVQRTVENHLYHALLHSRWVEPDGYTAFRRHYFADAPPWVRWTVPWLSRRRVRRLLWAEGTGWYKSPEILAGAEQDLDALSSLLADRPFFCGDQPSTVDAVAYGTLASIWFAPARGPLQHALGRRTAMVRFVERIRDRFWP